MTQPTLHDTHIALLIMAASIRRLYESVPPMVFGMIFPELVEEFMDTALKTALMAMIETEMVTA